MESNNLSRILKDIYLLFTINMWTYGSNTLPPVLSEIKEALDTLLLDLATNDFEFVETGRIRVERSEIDGVADIYLLIGSASLASLDNQEEN